MPNLKQQLARARELGLAVNKVRRTGEVEVIRPDGRPLRLNARRKEGVRELQRLIREVDDEGRSARG